MNNTNELQEKLDKIKILGEYQIQKSAYINFDISPLVGFEHKESGIFIINPFVDECNWNSVDPIEFYGEEFLNSDFFEINFDDVDKYRETEIIVFHIGYKIFEGSSYDFLDNNKYNKIIEDTVLEAIKNGRGGIAYSVIYTKEEYNKRSEVQ